MLPWNRGKRLQQSEVINKDKLGKTRGWKHKTVNNNNDRLTAFDPGQPG